MNKSLTIIASVFELCFDLFSGQSFDNPCKRLQKAWEIIFPSVRVRNDLEGAL